MQLHVPLRTAVMIGVVVSSSAGAAPTSSGRGDLQAVNVAICGDRTMVEPARLGDGDRVFLPDTTLASGIRCVADQAVCVAVALVPSPRAAMASAEAESSPIVPTGARP